MGFLYIALVGLIVGLAIGGSVVLSSLFGLFIAYLVVFVVGIFFV